MIHIPLSDPVEYLTHRQFPYFPEVINRGGVARQKCLSKIEAYQAELRAMPPEELQAFYEQVEDRERFFNRSYAQADFTHSSTAAYCWTLDEAIALSFGKRPEVVNWESVKRYVGVSPFVREYSKVRDLVLRAKACKELYDPVLPSTFLAWARRMKIEVPAELVEQFEARGMVIADSKDVCDKLKEQVDKLVEDRDKVASICKTLIQERDELKQKLEATQPTASDAPLRESERDSLLKMVLGMAMAAYDYKPGAARNTGTGENRGSISVDLQQLGLTLDADTVRKFIKEAETRFKDIIQNPHKF